MGNRREGRGAYMNEQKEKNIYVPLMHPSEMLDELHKYPVIYLPVGSIEWHNEHLPVGTDTLHASEISTRLARKTGGVVMPPFWWNTGSCHRHPVTYYMKEEFYEECLQSVCMGVAEMPCRVLVLVNGHGGENQNNFMLTVSCRLNSIGLPYKTIAADPYHLMGDYVYQIDHADTVETSLSMELIPEHVHMEREIGKDLYSGEFPFAAGPPDRETGNSFWTEYEKRALRLIRKTLEEIA